MSAQRFSVWDHILELVVFQWTLGWFWWRLLANCTLTLRKICVCLVLRCLLQGSVCPVPALTTLRVKHPVRTHSTLPLPDAARHSYHLSSHFSTCLGYLPHPQGFAKCLFMESSGIWQDESGYSLNGLLRLEKKVSPSPWESLIRSHLSGTGESCKEPHSESKSNSCSPKRNLHVVHPQGFSRLTDQQPDPTSFCAQRCLFTTPIKMKNDRWKGNWASVICLFVCFLSSLSLESNADGWGTTSSSSWCHSSCEMQNSDYGHERSPRLRLRPESVLPDSLPSQQETTTPALNSKLPFTSFSW